MFGRVKKEDEVSWMRDFRKGNRILVVWCRGKLKGKENVNPWDPQHFNPPNIGKKMEGKGLTKKW